MLIGHYQPTLVILSILVAMFASYTALSLALRVKESLGHARHGWMAGGAFAMGSGIWAMHFIGMLAFRLPMPMAYDPVITFVSWLLPVVVCGLALWQLRHRELGGRHLAWGALLMGLGINTMHYTGMSGMRMDPAITYDPWLFLASVAIAIGASAGALWIGFRLSDSVRHRRLVQAGAAIVMGGAIAGMHYTGMAAAHFDAASVCRAADGGVNQDHLAILVAVATFAVLSIALLAAIFDARLESRNRTLAASLETAAERQQLYLREQKARVEAEHLSQLKDEFLATLSHELRTPLNAMLGWSQLLLQGARDEAMLRRGLETIERNARAQSQLIEDMLDMSRLITGKVRVESKLVTPAEFVNAALETARPAALGKQIQLVADVDYDAGPVMGDLGRMQQVMSNLVSNAIKFTDPGGRVAVSLRREADAVAIDVQDSGIGIAPEFLPFVFDRFRQADASSSRRHGGLGLGLAIARQLVELQGGAVTVASPGAGRGATFTVHLPIHAAAVPESVPEPLAEPALDAVAQYGGALAGVTVLVVDDEPDSLDLVQQVLLETGARVLGAANAADALRMAALHRPDLLITDIGMPVVDGFELMRRVRMLPEQSVARVPSVALTAFSRREDQQRALEAGFDEFLAKPLRPALLLQVVVAMTGRQALSRV
ncbi:MHYT domain-containing protein [Massilia yuzhufengensis]|uniref:histidine kinase n=1 Tax=Massilia yuzhufengensis TaxID=1164594 RepID=A0A1I1MA51_9BURK|nr:MHYT domain-containing protein [Massilia yuzhufengensis]SFC80078.1 MHYT domain-containing protein, NO-binding membrane sensor [Massilia yuzhufengensis]